MQQVCYYNDFWSSLFQNPIFLEYALPSIRMTLINRANITRLGLRPKYIT